MLNVVLCLGLRHKRLLIYNSITLYMPFISLKRKELSIRTALLNYTLLMLIIQQQ
ncbi:hypothetical protein HMPREF1145_1012 [Oribacterium parvum ACB8]|nr:hypothetical protein HMPREF1145_1012 [Oribacterium parvum ACB8]